MAVNDLDIKLETVAEKYVVEQQDVVSLVQARVLKDRGFNSPENNSIIIRASHPLRPNLWLAADEVLDFIDQRSEKR